MALLPGEGEEEHRPCHERAEGVGRPASLCALDGAKEHADHGRRQQDSARNINVNGAVSLILGQDDQGAGEGNYAHDEVDQERGTPAGSSDVGGDECPSDQRASNSGDTQHGAKRAESLTHLLARECLADDAEALRDHQCAKCPLENPGYDDHRG